MIKKRFYVAKSGDVAYLNIAKSGCTAIKVALSDFRDSSPEQVGFNVHNPGDYDLLFLDVLSPGSRLLDQVFKFTFVRDPVDRALSFYRNKILIFDENVTPYYQERGIEYGCEADTFIQRLVDIDPQDLEEHLYPQAETVFEGEKTLVDWIGCLENIEEHWSELTTIIGHQVGIKAINKTEKDDRSEASPQSIAVLRKYYREDGYCFGYYQDGEVDERMKNRRARFESCRTARPHVGPDGQLVNRVYLENIHSQVAHLRRQVAGVNGRLDRMSEDYQQMKADMEPREPMRAPSFWDKWLRRNR
ncbi:sulfotransferase family 2 domain-containing protein [Alloalcanivorax sp. C16-1]|uniref:sulfotransferase family 2 domain-containing protein n=1 Tax=Alloalcanivorax sp. C16-1 TaxID=3390051 RepID=UPI0039704D1F